MLCAELLLGDKAVFVGALGEGIGAKFASQYPNIVFVDLLDGDKRIFNNPNRNYYYLPAKNVTEGSGAWEIDLYEQGFSAVDFSSALAQRISEKGYKRRSSVSFRFWIIMYNN